MDGKHPHSATRQRSAFRPTGFHPATSKHGKSVEAPETSKESDSESLMEKESKTFSGALTVATGKTTSLLPIVAVILRSHKHSIRTYALLDTGSEATSIRQDVADKLALEGPAEPSRICTYHADDPKATTKRVRNPFERHLQR